MAIELMPHQKEAIRKLHNGALLVAGVGTGKSLTALGYFTQKVLSKDPDIDLYIITTARKRDTHEWEMEAIKAGIGVEYNANYVVDSWNNIEKYITVEKAFFIFDEQRAMGNGKWGKTFVKIARKNKWIMLTATPGDTWMDYMNVFLANGFYRNKTEFVRRHVVYSAYTDFPKIERYLEVDELIKLREQIVVSMFLKKPATVHEEKIYVEYDESAYKTLLETRWDFEKDQPVENISQLCSMLRRIGNSSPGKQDEVKKLIKRHMSCIIFYNFDYELETLHMLLDEIGVVYAEWNGKRHEPIPKGKRWVYLVQYFAGAEGWNCTLTDTIIFYSLSYSYKTMEQAKGRIDRLNTPHKDIYYYMLVTKSSIDKGIERSLARKKTFNEKTFILKECLK